MRKKVFGRHLSREYGSRQALFRSQIRALVLYGKIKTTTAKAKSLETSIEKIMRKVSNGSLTSRRAVLAELGNDKQTVAELFGKYAALAKAKSSGFVKITSLPNRKGDNARMSLLEWVIVEENKKEDKKDQEKNE